MVSSPSQRPSSYRKLKVPDVEPGGLSDALIESWPSYATYVVSFLTIGIIWVNHHAVLDRIRNVNRPLLFMNLVFLMAVMGVTFGAIWAYAVLSEDLLHEGVDPERARRSLWIFAAGSPLYVLAIGVSLLSATLALAMYALLALFYLFDALPPLKQGDEEKGVGET